MKMFSVAVMSAAVLTGLAGAGVAYEIASAGDSTTTTTSVTPTTPTDAAKPRKHWAPCKPPAVREGKACVTDVVRTVVLPPAGGQVGVAFSGRSDDGPLHDAFDDHGDDFDDDHDAFDDHGGDRDGDFDDDDHSGHGGDDDDHDDHDDDDDDFDDDDD